MNRLILTFLLILSTQSSFAGSESEIELNNDGVRALNAEKYALAIQKFEQALKEEPSYRLARNNLAIAFNNYGLQKRETPQEAIKLFHMSAYLDASPVTIQNVDGIIKVIGLDPGKFEDRVFLGDRASREADFAGALWEYAAALRIKDDSEVKQKLAKVVLPEQWKALEIGAIKAELNPKDRDLAPYMQSIDQSIKAHWQPPVSNQSSRAEVVFTVDSAGKVSKLKLTKSSGSVPNDNACLKAVTDAAPLPKLPPGSPTNVDISFSFDYTAESENDYNVAELGRWKKNVAGLEKAGGTDLARALLRLASLYAENSQVTQAESTSKRAIKIFNDSSTASGADRIDGYTCLGDVYYSYLKKYPEAEVQYKKALEIAQTDPKSTELSIAKCKFELAKSMIENDQADQAITLMQAVIAFTSKQTKVADDQGFDTDGAKLLLANAYWTDGQYGKALTLYQAALKKAEQESDTDGLADRLKDVADCLYELNRKSEAVPLYKKAVAILKTNKSSNGDDLFEEEQRIVEIRNQANPNAGLVEKVSNHRALTLDGVILYGLSSTCCGLFLLWYLDLRKKNAARKNSPKS